MTPRAIRQTLSWAVLTCCTFGCVSNSGTSRISKASADTSPHFVLYSWIKNDHSNHFAIIAESERPRFLDHFNRRMPGISGVADLEIALDRLPRPVLIIWSTSADVGLGYPDERVVNSVRRFARSKNIDLRVEPAIEE